MMFHPANFHPRRILWNLCKFGLTPSKLWQRRSCGSVKGILCVCIPKAGTHLLERILCLHPCLSRKPCRTIRSRWFSKERTLRIIGSIRPGQIALAHLPFHEDVLRTAREHGTKILFLVRDPRDVVLSMVHFIERWPRHPRHARLQEEQTRRDRYLLTIRGDPSADLRSIGDIYREYEPWLLEADLTIRFEDLLDQRGAVRTTVVSQVFHAVGIHLTPDIQQNIVRHAVSRASLTFDKGMQGGWKHVFDEKLLSTFREATGSILTDYGYDSHAAQPG